MYSPSSLMTLNLRSAVTLVVSAVRISLGASSLLATGVSLDLSFAQITPAAFWVRVAEDESSGRTMQVIRASSPDSENTACELIEISSPANIKSKIRHWKAERTRGEKKNIELLLICKDSELKSSCFFLWVFPGYFFCSLEPSFSIYGSTWLRCCNSGRARRIKFKLCYLGDLFMLQIKDYFEKLLHFLGWTEEGSGLCLVFRRYK